MPKRAVHIVLLMLLSFTMLGASDTNSRFEKLGHKLMCTCGCGEILLECNHMGCPDSPRLISSLNAQLASGASNDGVLNWFAQNFGPTVLAAPIRGGFDLVAWIVPFAVLGLGIVAILWILRHWRDRHARTVLATSGAGADFTSGASEHVRERIRRDTGFEP